MAVQMTFEKHTTVRNYFTAIHAGVYYLVTKSAFGWHAKFRKDGDQRYEDVKEILYDNRGQAQYACDLHANGGL